jgi:hypothetical protein
MLAASDSIEALTALFRNRPVADLATLFEALQTKSRMSVFRRLSAIGYLTSYTHAGRFYTLRGLPAFDRDGLWCHQGVCFSRQGSLKATIPYVVDNADAGRTQHELQVRLRVRVHNTLLDLVREKRIGRETWAAQYLYVSADAARAAAQLSLRQAQPEMASETAAAVTTSAVIDVLLDLVRSAGVQVDVERIAERLNARGIAVTPEQVEDIFRRHGVKKTARSRSKRLRP